MGEILKEHSPKTTGPLPEDRTLDQAFSTADTQSLPCRIHHQLFLLPFLGGLTPCLLFPEAPLPPGVLLAFIPPGVFDLSEARANQGAAVMFRIWPQLLLPGAADLKRMYELPHRVGMLQACIHWAVKRDRDPGVLMETGMARLG